MKDMQRIQAPLTAFSEFGNRWMAIATEMATYTERSFQDGSATLSKLMGAKSIVEAIEIQTEFAKRAYDAHVKEMAKISDLYRELAKLPSQAGQ